MFSTVSCFGGNKPNSNIDTTSSTEDTRHSTVKAFDSIKKTIPEYKYNNSYNQGNIRAIEYQGADYNGASTNVFAYVGYPSGASETNKKPAVVLVHGGGGTAFFEWVKVWNDAGYIAIAMDTEGRRPDQSTNGLGGPCNDIFSSINAPLENQWMYQAVSAVILAHNYLRDDYRVDTKNIGICGISWGGIISSITLGIDDRFAFGTPIYGCGYLREGGGFFNETSLPSKMDDIWDASNFFKNNKKTKVLFLNSDHDGFFPIDITNKSSNALTNSKIAILPNMLHGHYEGWNEKESIAFADQVVKKNNSFANFTSQELNDKTIKITYEVPNGCTLDNIAVYGTSSIEYQAVVGGVDKIKNDFTKLDIDLNNADNKVSFTIKDSSLKYVYVNFQLKNSNNNLITTSSKLFEL